MTLDLSAGVLVSPLSPSAAQDQSKKLRFESYLSMRLDSSSISLITRNLKCYSDYF